jgi:hypothetical protein
MGNLQNILPRHALGELLPCEPSSSEPVEYDLWRDAHGRRGAFTE